MRFITVLLAFPLVWIAAGIDMWRTDARIATAAERTSGMPPAPPFLALETGVDALKEATGILAARGRGLRVYDGEGRDVGRYAGRDLQVDFQEPSESSLRGSIHVFFEAAGVIANYSPDGQLAGLEARGPLLWYVLPDCQGPAYFHQVGVAGASPFDGSEVMVTGTGLQAISAESSISIRPSGALSCRNRTAQINLAAVQFLDASLVGIPIRIPPLLYTAPAE